MLISSRGLHRLRSIYSRINVVGRKGIVVRHSLFSLRKGVDGVRITYRANVPGLPGRFRMLRVSGSKHMCAVVIGKGPERITTTVRARKSRLTVISVLPLALRRVFVCRVKNLNCRIGSVLFWPCNFWGGCSPMLTSLNVLSIV